MLLDLHFPGRVVLVIGWPRSGPPRRRLYRIHIRSHVEIGKPPSVGVSEIGKSPPHPHHGVEIRVISAPVRFDGRPEKERREAFDFRTVTCSFPSSPICVSVSRKSCPSKETTSESTLKATIEAAVSGNWSHMRVFAARNSKRKRRRVYHIMHWRTTTWTMRLPEYSPYMAMRSGIPITNCDGPLEASGAAEVGPEREDGEHDDFLEGVGGYEAEVHSVDVVLGDEVEGEERDGEDGHEAVDAGALVGSEDLPPADGAVRENHGHVEGDHGCQDDVQVVPAAAATVLERRRFKLVLERERERGEEDVNWKETGQLVVELVQALDEGLARQLNGDPLAGEENSPVNRPEFVLPEAVVSGERVGAAAEVGEGESLRREGSQICRRRQFGIRRRG
ncbi:ATP synthase subunit b [Striga asiatica]|uniref:ATP synthase subunit b n=1 Tax=Striga asiatica TaxID=4170 RepID=A0A5A7QHR9_STRAF|nr:ATP synthase subunit b [Striga asiatica]